MKFIEAWTPVTAILVIANRQIGKGKQKKKQLFLNTQKESLKQDCFSLFFNIITYDISALIATIPLHCIPIKKEASIMIFQNLLHSIHNLIIVFQMATV